MKVYKTMDFKLVAETFASLSDARCALSSAYEALAVSMQKSQDLRKRWTIETAILQEERNEIINAHAADPKALGANEAAREATLQARTSIQQGIVNDSKQELDDALAVQAQMALGVERLRADLRCLEAMAALLTGGKVAPDA